jgi:hypothetical protein
MVTGAAVVLLSLFVGLTIKLINRPAPKHVQVAQVQVAKSDVVKTQSGVSAPVPLDNKVQLHLDTKVNNPPVASPPKKEKKKPEHKKVEPEEIKVQGVNQSSRVRTLIETTGAPALVSLVVKPWGEISLDGRIQGVSPPLLELQVVEGKHVIKISNTTFPSVTQTITVKAGEKIKIKHKFAD